MRGILNEGVFSADDVRGELVAIFAAVAADVALEWVSVTVAAHVDGVHDVVHEQDAAVFALEHPQLLAFAAEDADESLAATRAASIALLPLLG